MVVKIIAFINQKGGVGKTTTTINVGVGLGRQGKKVLLIDLDSQANLTTSLGFDLDELKYSVYDLMKGSADFKDVLLDYKGVGVIPSHIALSGSDLELSGVTGRELLLKEALEGNIDGYDYVLLDCPPSLGLLTLNALVSAREIYIVLQAEYLALQGMKQLLDSVAIIKKRLNKNLEITGIIGTQFDNRKKLNKEVMDKIREHFGSKVFNTLIRDNVSLAEAPSHGLDIYSYKPDTYGAADYSQLTTEVIERG
jgi:chromosome partitioning protein